MVLYLLCRICVADRFHIPTNSMHPTLMEGDNIVVNKLLFGARIYKDYNFSHRECQMQCWRVPGTRDIHYNDIIVFNRAKHKNNISFTINEVYCKRCVALPGDSISIIDGYYVNNHYCKLLGSALEQEKLRLISDSLIHPKMLRAMPKEEHFSWTIKNFGPIYMPRKGDIMKLTPYTATIYRVIVEWELGKRLDIHWDDNVVLLDGQIVKKHRFLHNYYFMAGDNVLDSYDSRYQGPVPEEYIIGVATRILYSKNEQTNQIRWERTGKKIK